MQKAKKGDTVTVNYIGTFKDGTEFDRSTEGNPIEFTIGAQQLIPGFEQAVIDMEPGQTKKVTIPSGQAYGEYRNDDVVEVPRSEFPDTLALEVGIQLEAQNQEGAPIIVTVIALSDTSVTLDANHSLAGKDLTFEISLVEIKN